MQTLNTRWRWLFFAATMLLFLGFPFQMIRHTQQIRTQGTPYRFLLEPLDPYDAFRGRYVNLFYGNPQTPARDSLAPGQTCYVALQQDTNGRARFAGAYAQPPATDWLKTRVLYSTEDKQVVFGMPESMNYYYLNEKIAPEVEKIIRQPQPERSDTPSVQATVSVRVLKGEAVIEALYINDLPILEYLRRASAQSKSDAGDAH